MNKEPNDELEDLFDIEKMSKEVKKVKRRSISKTAVIIIGIILLILAGVLGYLYISNKVASDKARKQAENYVSFVTTINEFYKYPNTILQTSTEISDNNRKVEVSEINFKLLKDRFTPFTTATISLGSDGIGSGYPTIEINLEEKEKDGEKYNVGINDLTTGNRLADFFHPRKEYSPMKQDLKNLSEFPKNSYLEMAISFDKAYSSEEVERMLPKNLKPTFFWLDGYDLSIDDMPSPINEKLYGYDNPSNNLEKKFWGNPVKDEQDYIKRMKLSNFTFYSNGSISQDGTVHGSGKSVYKVLKTKSDKGEKLVIGISIVATKEELQQLVGANYIRASSVGVISNAVDATNYYEQTGEIH
ncbi:hypothetical protein VV27_14630 [Listeria monocytogenes]|uniref:anti sigma factor C-terminal domain-containing protein n=1 Tax=Listeria monocytogenes TaxID=1639 RepID=UPI0010BA221E|nr:anti sigma factor C-terminal domain-containing protein [Listeria monocytogenes]EAC3456748.1 hypothetical protein [Listeria monocytogenes]EAC4365714.1 hypothetical protein [Listeria monocytogenes]EAC4831009.1 hypothetical protein [Listeria monocytogenes]EAC5024919.1 hypothetical protein [Listeria monocytogenes]EAC6175364.1 hypothetical protein [Listeria monocytogenes]